MQDREVEELTIEVSASMERAEKLYNNRAGFFEAMFSECMLQNDVDFIMDTLRLSDELRVAVLKHMDVLDDELYTSTSKNTELTTLNTDLTNTIKDLNEKINTLNIYLKKSESNVSTLEHQIRTSNIEHDKTVEALKEQYNREIKELNVRNALLGRPEVKPVVDSENTTEPVHVVGNRNGHGSKRSHGHNHGKTALTCTQIELARKAISDGMPKETAYKFYGKKFNASRSAISRAVRCKSYKHCCPTKDEH